MVKTLHLKIQKMNFKELSLLIKKELNKININKGESINYCSKGFIGKIPKVFLLNQNFKVLNSIEIIKLPYLIN